MNTKCRGHTPLQLVLSDGDPLFGGPGLDQNFNSLRKAMLGELIQAPKHDWPRSIMPSLNGYPFVDAAGSALTPALEQAGAKINPPEQWHEHPLLHIIIGYQNARTELFTSDAWRVASPTNDFDMRRQELYELNVRPWLSALMDLADCNEDRRNRAVNPENLETEALITRFAASFDAMTPKLNFMFPHENWVDFFTSWTASENPQKLRQISTLRASLLYNGVGGTDGISFVLNYLTPARILKSKLVTDWLGGFFVCAAYLQNYVGGNKTLHDRSEKRRLAEDRPPIKMLPDDMLISAHFSV